MRNKMVLTYTEGCELPLFAICNFFDQLDGICPIHLRNSKKGQPYPRIQINVPYKPTFNKTLDQTAYAHKIETPKYPILTPAKNPQKAEIHTSL